MKMLLSIQQDKAAMEGAFLIESYIMGKIELDIYRLSTYNIYRTSIYVKIRME